MVRAHADARLCDGPHTSSKAGAEAAARPLRARRGRAQEEKDGSAEEPLAEQDSGVEEPKAAAAMPPLAPPSSLEAAAPERCQARARRHLRPPRSAHLARQTQADALSCAAPDALQHSISPAQQHSVAEARACDEPQAKQEVVRLHSLAPTFRPLFAHSRAARPAVRGSHVSAAAGLPSAIADRGAGATSPLHA